MRTALCDKCPQKQKKDRFRNNTLEMWEGQIGAMSGRFEFDDFMMNLHTIIRLDGSADKAVSVKSGILLAVYQTEKMKFERMKRNF